MQLRLVRVVQGLCFFALSAAGSAMADAISSTSVIYAAGTQAALAAGAGGSLPYSLSLTSGTTAVTFAVSAGTITLNNGTGNNNNDADGAQAAVTSSFNSGAGSLSGLTAPGAGFLAGVFVGPGGPGGAAPAALNFLPTSLGTSFTTLSPLLDQVFFIGDGLTGDGTGATQSFNVPGNAATLYLGISDACGYSGGPSCYGDNVGSFAVTVSQTGGTGVTPEPSSLLLCGSGLLGVAGALRRRLA